MKTEFKPGAQTVPRKPLHMLEVGEAAITSKATIWLRVDETHLVWFSMGQVGVRDSRRDGPDDLDPAYEVAPVGTEIKITLEKGS